MFDILVDIFHEELEARGLITARQEDLSDRLEDWPDYHRVIQPIFDRAYAAAPAGFRESLVVARDILGTYLAETWRQLSPDSLGYVDVGRTLLAIDRKMSGGRYQKIIEVNLARRAIGYARVGPRLKPPGPKSHFNLSRVFLPPEPDSCCRRRLSYSERYERAAGLP